MTIRLVLADEQPVYRLGLESLLAANPGFEITANCADGEATLRAVEEQRPDILMVDLHLPRLDTLDLLRKIRGAGIPLPVVVLTAALNEDDLLAMMPLGVRGVVLKTMPVEHIIRCLFKVQGGDTWLEMHSVSLALDKLLSREARQQSSGGSLTERELELTILAAQGLSNREIASRTFISEGTVKGHLHKVFDKLKVKNRTGLGRVARERGWV